MEKNNFSQNQSNNDLTLKRSFNEEGQDLEKILSNVIKLKILNKNTRNCHKDHIKYH